VHGLVAHRAAAASPARRRVRRRAALAWGGSARPRHVSVTCPVGSRRWTSSSQVLRCRPPADCCAPFTTRLAPARWRAGRRRSAINDAGAHNMVFGEDDVPYRVDRLLPRDPPVTRSRTSATRRGHCLGRPTSTTDGRRTRSSASHCPFRSSHSSRPRPCDRSGRAAAGSAPAAMRRSLRPAKRPSVVEDCADRGSRFVPTHDLFVLARSRRSSRLEATVAIAQNEKPRAA
jgi:hypothetical protein